jgi:hypothetical protein
MSNTRVTKANNKSLVWKTKTLNPTNIPGATWVCKSLVKFFPTTSNMVCIARLSIFHYSYLTSISKEITTNLGGNVQVLDNGVSNLHVITKLGYLNNSQ